jgi:hypothetical protein
LGVVVGFKPPDEAALDDVVAGVVVLELELESLDPQPAANVSAEAITTAGKPLLIERSFLGRACI